MAKTAKLKSRRRFRFEADMLSFQFNPVRLSLVGVFDSTAIATEGAEVKPRAYEVQISMPGDVLVLGTITEDVSRFVGMYSNMRLTVAIRYEQRRLWGFTRVYQICGRTRRGWSNEPFIEITKRIDLPRVAV